MIRSFVHRIGPSRRAHRHRTVICVPSSMTSAEQRAVREAAELAGARYVVVVEKPMAAAIGAGLPVKQEAPSMIVDVGGGTTDVAVTSLGSIVASRSIRVAGDDLDAAIAAYASRNQGLVLESRAAEAVKIEMGSACPLAIELEAEVWGRDLRTGLRRSILITTEQIRSALHRPVSAIVGVVRATLDELPPAIAAGIVKRGIVLAGGGALLHGLAGRIQAETGAPVEVAADPLRCVAIGAGRYLEAYGTDMVGHLLTAS
jgi:rod shape-determining protein MreB